MIFVLSMVLILSLIFIGVSIPLSFLTGSFFLAIFAGAKVGSFATNAYYMLNSISMLAIPLFVVGGQLVERSGIANVLIEVGDRLLHKVKGGMAAAIPVVSCFFGAMCGSALATANTLASAMAPDLVRKGWDKRYVAALIAASSPMGFMIPPNVNAIVFSTAVSGASVGELFMATIIPAIIWTGLYLIINSVIYVNYYTPVTASFTLGKEISVAQTEKTTPNRTESETLTGYYTEKRSQFWLKLAVAVGLAIVVLGGIYGGIFTATEAGAIMCLYATLAGVIVYRNIKLNELFGIFAKGAKDVSVLVILFPMTMIFSRILTLNHVPDMFAELVLSLTENKVLIILMIDLLLFILGFFIDGNVIILTVVPMLVPVTSAVGISTIQLAVIVFVAIGIGAITPPMATCLLSCSRICDVSVKDMMKPLMPFLLLGALPVLLLVSFVPALSEWLPALIYGV